MAFPSPRFALSIVGLSLGVAASACGQSGRPASAGAVAATDGEDSAASWQESEAGVLADHVQLTFAERFLKAGEAYFSPDDSRIIFQAVEKPVDGRPADPFYAMYVADVAHGTGGLITGIENIRRLSPEGSANTCGWFHPTDPDVVLFGSTITEPTDKQPPGFEGLSRRYRWMFPPEMKIVRCRLDEADGTAGSLEVVVGDDTAYQAEGSLSTDGRHLLFCSLGSGLGDLFVKDMHSGSLTRLVGADGYDGGPFFSPEGARICYRSDRRLNHYLQLYVADLVFDRSGAIKGIEREYQLTDDAAVNWCPFWHPSGRFLVFATSRQGHQNYEVYMMDADPGNLAGSTGTVRYGTRQRRITNATGADVLPAFNSDGSVMLWTSQRGADGESQLWAARFVIDLEASPVPPGERRESGVATSSEDPEDQSTINVRDPLTGLVYMYDPVTHEVSVYDPLTHKVRDVADDEEMERVRELFRDR